MGNFRHESWSKPARTITWSYWNSCQVSILLLDLQTHCRENHVAVGRPLTSMIPQKKESHPRSIMKKLHAALFHLSIILDALPKATAAAYELEKTGDLHRQLTLYLEQQPQSPPLAGSHDGRLSNNIATEAVLLNPLEELRKAVAVMQSTWFENWVGTWPTGIDWTRAVVDTHLISSVGTLSKALLDFRTVPSLSESTTKDIEDDINRYFSQHVSRFLTFRHSPRSACKPSYVDSAFILLSPFIRCD